MLRWHRLLSRKGPFQGAKAKASVVDLHNVDTTPDMPVRTTAAVVRGGRCRGQGLTLSYTPLLAFPLLLLLLYDAACPALPIRHWH